MRESYIEKKVCDYAKSKGWLVYKFTSPSNRGVPDRILIRSGQVVFIEFKAPGKKPTPLQHSNLNKIRAEGVCALVIDDIYEGIRALDKLMGA